MKMHPLSRVGLSSMAVWTKLAMPPSESNKYYYSNNTVGPTIRGGRNQDMTQDTYIC